MLYYGRGLNVYFIYVKKYPTNSNQYLILWHFYDKTMPFYFASVHGYQCFDSKELIKNTSYFLSTIIGSTICQPLHLSKVVELVSTRVHTHAGPQ